MEMKMSAGGNADAKWDERKMEGEDSVRTVECLRGRLLAERVASRNAKVEAEQLGNKLRELENQLKHEAKSKNRAEKKLKFLMKKLESMNISHVSDESEYSTLVDKSDISSISSTTSSSNKEQRQHNENQQTKISNVFETQESKGKAICQKKSGYLNQIDSQNCSLSHSDDSSIAEGSSISAFEANLTEKVWERETRQNEDPMSPKVSEIFEQHVARNGTFVDSLTSESEEHSDRSSLRMDQRSDICSDNIKSSVDTGLNKEDDQDPVSQIDNSMALVLVDPPPPPENHTIDPEVLDATVKEVLDALRYAKEQLQISMERRRRNVIKVG